MKIVTSQEFREEILKQVVNRGKTDLSSISLAVRKIITDVRENGDEALLRYTEKFDNIRLTRSNCFQWRLYHSTAASASSWTSTV